MAKKAKSTTKKSTKKTTKNPVVISFTKKQKAAQAVKMEAILTATQDAKKNTALLVKSMVAKGVKHNAIMSTLTLIHAGKDWPKQKKNSPKAKKGSLIAVQTLKKNNKEYYGSSTLCKQLNALNAMLTKYYTKGENDLSVEKVAVSFTASTKGVSKSKISKPTTKKAKVQAVQAIANSMDNLHKKMANADLESLIGENLRDKLEIIILALKAVK